MSAEFPDDPELDPMWRQFYDSAAESSGSEDPSDITADAITAPADHDTNHDSPPGKLADDLFEVNTSDHPPTHTEQQDLHGKRNSLDWLGDYTTDPMLLWEFDDSRGGVLTEERAESVIESQLSRLGNSIVVVENSLRATADLADIAEEHANRTVIDSGTVLGMGNNNQRQAGPFVFVDNEQGGVDLRSSDDNLDLVDKGNYSIYSHPSGEIRLINFDSSDRYILEPGDGGTLTHEVVRTIAGGTAEYFRDLNGSLAAHKALLLEVAAHAGFSSADLIDPESGLMNGDNLGKLTQAAANTTLLFNLPDELRGRLVDSATVINASITPSHTENPLTGRVELDGLQARARRTREYVDAFLRYRATFQ